MEADNLRVSLSVLIRREDDEFVAHALEMDLVGFGDTPGAAMKDLHDHVVMQLSFVLQQQGDIDKAFFPADEECLELYNRVKLQALRNAVRGAVLQNAAHNDYIPADMPVPDAHVIEAMRGDFAAGHA